MCDLEPFSEIQSHIQLVVRIYRGGYNKIRLQHVLLHDEIVYLLNRLCLYAVATNSYSVAPIAPRSGLLYIELYCFFVRNRYYAIFHFEVRILMSQCIVYLQCFSHAWETRLAYASCCLFSW